MGLNSLGLPWKRLRRGLAQSQACSASQASMCCHARSLTVLCMATTLDMSDSEGSQPWGAGQDRTGREGREYSIDAGRVCALAKTWQLHGELVFRASCEEGTPLRATPWLQEVQLHDCGLVRSRRDADYACLLMPFTHAPHTKPSAAITH